MAALARREHSRLELHHKLRARDIDEQVIESVLDALASAGYQDDARYADAYVRQRSERGYGPRRITRELAERGVADGAITAALEHAGVDWFELAVRAQRKKFRTGPDSLNERSRQTRFMEYRGFDFEQIRHALDMATADEDR